MEVLYDTRTNSDSLPTVTAGSHVRRKHKSASPSTSVRKRTCEPGHDASTSASARKRKSFLLLALTLVLASSRFTRTFSCACAYACVVASYVWTSLNADSTYESQISLWETPTESIWFQKNLAVKETFVTCIPCGTTDCPNWVPTLWGFKEADAMFSQWLTQLPCSINRPFKKIWLSRPTKIIQLKAWPDAWPILLPSHSFSGLLDF